MGYYLIKADKDLDLYVEWSSIVEAPTFVGTRQEILDYLIENEQQTSGSEDPARRLARTDLHGSSMIDNRFESWEDPGIMAEQRWLKRGRIGAYSLLYVLGDQDGARLLTEDPE
jgi:hypothetical protein